MKAPFASPYATMKENIDQMYLHSRSIDEENESRSEMQQCSPIVDNKVLLVALDQRAALLEALKEIFDEHLFLLNSMGKDYMDNEKLIKAKAAIAAADGDL